MTLDILICIRFVRVLLLMPPFITDIRIRCQRCWEDWVLTSTTWNTDPGGLMLRFCSKLWWTSCLAKYFRHRTLWKGKRRFRDSFFPFHSFLFGIIHIKNYFLVQIEKAPKRFLKLFFKLMVNLLPFYFFISVFFSTFANVILNTIFLP